MKKFLSVILSVVLAFGFFAQCCQADELEAQFLSEIEYKGVPGTTPFEEGIELFTVDEAAAEKSRQILNNLSKFQPEDYMLTDKGLNVANPWDEMTSSELSWVKNKSAQITQGLTTPNEKIRAVAEYVAKNVGYDHDYYTHGTKEYEDLKHTAYDILYYEYGVCYGYSAACCVLLQAADIPCIMIDSPNHQWNMAYDGTRWVMFDTTWMSNCRYEYGTLKKNNKINEYWYDFTPETAFSNKNHTIETTMYCEYNNGIYDFPVYSKNITNYVIPAHIDTIGEFAFNQCQIPITSEAILKNVGRAAFQGCTNLGGTVNLKEVEVIEPYAFNKCTGLKGIITSNKLKSVGRTAFQLCSSMTGNINLSKTELIDSYAFNGCEKITGVVLGNKLTNIPYSAFSGCISLREIVFPKSITQIDSYSFYGANSLQTVYYTGTQTQWNSITGGNSLKKATKVYNYEPKIVATQLTDGSYRLSYQGILLDERVAVAEYEDGKLIELQIAPIQKTMNFSSKASNSDKIKFMVFESATALCPALKPVEINK